MFGEHPRRPRIAKTRPTAGTAWAPRLAWALLWLGVVGLGGACGVDDFLGLSEADDDKSPARQHSHKTRPRAQSPSHRRRQAGHSSAASPGLTGAHAGARARLAREVDALELRVGGGLGLQHVDALRRQAQEGARLLGSAAGNQAMPPPHGDMETLAAVYAFAAWAAEEAGEVKRRTSLAFGPQPSDASGRWGWELKDERQARSPFSLAAAEQLLGAHIVALQHNLAPLAQLNHPRVERVRDGYVPALQRLYRQIARQIEGAPADAGMSFADFVGGASTPGLAPAGDLAAARRAFCRLLGLPDDDPELSDAQIRRAYRRRSREIHPDKWQAPEAHAAFVELQAAKATYEGLAAGNRASR